MNTTTLHPALAAAGSGHRRSAFDWLFAALVVGGAAWAFQRYRGSMDGYEQAILIGAAPALIALGWFWGALRPLTLIVGAAALAGIGLYAGARDDFGADLSAANRVFLLKYGLSSQSAILWMALLTFMSTLAYWAGLFIGTPAGRTGALAAGGATGTAAAPGTTAAPNTAQRLGSAFAWGAVGMALVGTLVRWFESHQIGPDIGHIPVSNLYEVFVLFAWLTTLFWLYYEQRYASRALGAFAMLIVSASVGFLLWYTVSREAHEIQPLVPALQSWWMKVHVPANFVGYGTFALAAMVGLASLLKVATARALWVGLVVLPLVFGLLPCLAFQYLGDVQPATAGALGKTVRMLAGLIGFFAAAIALRGPINARTPALAVMDDLMYRAIAIGFAFFTIATILGAFWAAEAWGGYWSWDPKETWALIVWLNYAAWLHMRLIKGLRGAMAAWWSLVGLVITTFAFLGVNMFLSGLHSYGTL